MLRCGNSKGSGRWLSEPVASRDGRDRGKMPSYRLRQEVDHETGTRHMRPTLRAAHLCPGVIEAASGSKHDRQPTRGFEVARLNRMDYNSTPELCFVDEGYSGGTLLRPALERLRDQAAAGAIDRLYVHRRIASPQVCLSGVARRGIAAARRRGRLPQSPHRPLPRGGPAASGPGHDRRIRARPRSSNAAAAASGTRPAAARSTCSAAHRTATATSASTKGAARRATRSSMNEAAVVRQIFEWVGTGTLLDRRGVPALQKSRQFPVRDGKPSWDRTTVWGILKNPAYKGRAAVRQDALGPTRPRLRPQRGKPAQPRRAGSDLRHLG